MDATANWAVMSPMAERGKRTLASMMSQMSCTGSPFLTTMVGGRRTPSWKISTESIGTPGSLAPMSSPVGPGGGEAGQVALVEDGGEDRDVMHVGAGEVGVVHDPDVALTPYRAPEHLLGGQGAGLQVAEEQRNPRRLAQDPVPAVDERHRAVLGLVDDRRVGRADQRRVHLLGSHDEGVTEDLDGDRVGVSKLCLVPLASRVPALRVGRARCCASLATALPAARR